MGYRLAHHRHLMAPLRQRQIGPTAHHRVRVAARQDTDRRCGRGGIGHSQFADAEGFHPVGSELAGELHAGQQHRLRLLAAHRRRPGDIPATAGHFEVNQARQRVASMPTSTTCTLAPACAASTQTPVLPRTILPA